MGSTVSKRSKKKGTRNQYIERYDSKREILLSRERGKVNKTAENEEKMDEEDDEEVTSPYFLPMDENLENMFDKVREEHKRSLSEQLHPATEYVKLGYGDCRIQIHKRTKSVRLYPGEILDAIIINGHHIGGKGGNRSEVLILRKDEFIEYIEVDYCNYYGHSVVGRIHLRTNQDRKLEGGLARGDIKESVKHNGMINFVGGRCDGGRWRYLNHLEFAVEPRPRMTDYKDLDEKERTQFVLEEDEVIDRISLKLGGIELSDSVPSILFLGN